VTSEEEAHFRVLKAIEANPDVTQRELAEALGLSLGKINFLVNALLEKGAIKMENFRRSDTKLKKIAYLLTPNGIAERIRLTQAYLQRKRMEYENLKAEIESLEMESAKLVPKLREANHKHAGRSTSAG
jgi:EPS-associated MarR family transcriptional regulator